MTENDLSQPAPTPAGVEVVLAVLPKLMSDDHRRALLDTRLVGLDNRTPVQWLIDDGPVSGAITALADNVGEVAQSLVDQLVTLIGSELTAYIASQRDTTAVHWWREGIEEPPTEAIARLAVTFHVAFVLRAALSPGAIHSWIKRRSPLTQGRAPASLLRDGTSAADLVTLAAAEDLVASPELHAEPTLDDVLKRARQLWAEPTATSWIYSRNENYLEGARPIDLIHLGRGQEVLDALDGVEQGGIG